MNSFPTYINQGDTDEPNDGNHTYRKDAATFGHAPGTQASDPGSIMKKNTGAKPVASLKEIRMSSPELLRTSTLKQKNKAPVPSHTDKPVNIMRL